jgi:hypothetical protein
MKLTKGRMYCWIHAGGFSFGTYLGRTESGLVFNGSCYAMDSCRLHGEMQENTARHLIEIPPYLKTEDAVAGFIESCLPE